MLTVAEQHAVPESLSGMIHQLDTALLWLAEGSISASVGVETLDDIARIDDGVVELGQSKISYSRNPLTDHSKNFWGTLSTWLSMIDAEERDIVQDRFLFISNFSIKTGLVASLKNANGDKKAVREFVSQLRNTGSMVTGEAKSSVDIVLNPSRSDDSLVDFFAKVGVIDGTPIDPLIQNQKLQAKLHLTDDIAEQVVRGLRGWVQEKVQHELAQRQPAWLSREHFCEEYQRLVSVYRNRALYLRTVRDFIITQAERDEQKDAVFIRQLRLIGINDNGEEILDAINDFLMSASERTRLCKETNITGKVFADFESQLVERWKPLHRLYKRQEKSAEESGYELYCKILDHREPLGGQPTDEFYFTRGTYHHLANATQGLKPKLGWHPTFDKLI